MSIQVFKFGGASVKNAEAVRNVANILKYYSNAKIMVVVSAMAKTTNALEVLLSEYRHQSSYLQSQFEAIKHFHFTILSELSLENNSEAMEALEAAFDSLEQRIHQPLSTDCNEDYASIVGFGELFSSLIIFHYLRHCDFNIAWRAAGDYIVTNRQFKEATVDWTISPQRIAAGLKPVFKEVDIVISQGFIATSHEGKTTTLGREGSDYSAAIFAYGLDAENLTIWKDVPGLLNADPKYFQNTQKLDYISYRETIELAYYGASIIHPKTIQPLQNKQIPLLIKSFIQPLEKGSVVQSNTQVDRQIPSYIFKKNQVLISISARDFAFIAEQHLSAIFNLLSNLGLKINLMQNSAISFSICMDNHSENLQQFIEELQKEFNVKYNEQMELITIRHYNQDIINDLIGERKVYLEQKNRTTVQLLVR
jgi:aspartate kinase